MTEITQRPDGYMVLDEQDNIVCTAPTWAICFAYVGEADACGDERVLVIRGFVLNKDPVDKDHR